LPEIKDKGRAKVVGEKQTYRNGKCAADSERYPDRIDDLSVVLEAQSEISLEITQFRICHQMTSRKINAICECDRSKLCFGLFSMSVQ
jgi:hypothetical protein